MHFEADLPHHADSPLQGLAFFVANPGRCLGNQIPRLWRYCAEVDMEVHETRWKHQNVPSHRAVAVTD